MSLLDDLLESKELADDLEISIGDKTAKVSDLRALRSEYSRTRDERDAIASERDTIRNERDNLTRSVTDLLGKAGRMTDDDARRPDQPADIKATLRDALNVLLEKDDPSAALFEDKVFGKALTRVEENAVKRAMAENAELKATVTELQNLVKGGFEAMTRAQVHERENRWYDINRKEIPKGQDGKPVSLAQIRQYAAQRNMYIPGEDGRPTALLDFDTALNTLTEPTRQEARMSEAEQRGYQKGLEAARTKGAQVLPLFGDRSAGGGEGGKQIKTAGKTQKQIVQESLQQGLADLASGNE
jgi:Holliday junction resolvase RusA-like endonuclease